ncbi:MAG TPA: hypothetical protein DEB39_00245 [Planctomycetaceae bacterium]|nr:hypothetical protein [Planctomycetaceae bacterium]
MFGPVFIRELTIAPRREATFVLRSLYAGVLMLLVVTAWLVFSGTQLITDIGDFARFAQTLFTLLAPLQLVLLTFFAAMLSAGAVAQEKDRKTLVLLLLTRMSNAELVLGKLMAGLLPIFSMLLVSIPVFMLVVLLGGVSYPQVVRVFLTTFFSILVFGSLGSMVALWREKTFQALATTLLLLVIWIGLFEAVGAGMLGSHWGPLSTKAIAAALSPWTATLNAAYPAVETNWLAPIMSYLTAAGLLAVFVNAIAVAMVRVWNPSRETRSTTIEQDTWIHKQGVEETLADAIAFDKIAEWEATRIVDKADEPAVKGAVTSEDVTNENVANEAEVIRTHGAGGRVRHAWDNPILWREVRTRAYGRKIWMIQAAYMLFFAMCAWSLHSIVQTQITPSPAQLAAPLVPLIFLSLVLVNAQAVSSLTSERDGGTFDLLLVSDITPGEFVFGKLGGIFYNMKWCILLPLSLCIALYAMRGIDGSTLFYLLASLAVLYLFVAMIGLHIGMNYENTRTAAAMSLGIVFFLFVGVAACIWIMIVFSGSFQTQLQPFLAFMLGGGIGLYLTLGGRNPSQAITLSAFLLPPFTFYVITSLLLGDLHLGFAVGALAYGFTTAAMLIPAVAEFDVATGRTTAD